VSSTGPDKRVRSATTPTSRPSPAALLYALFFSLILGSCAIQLQAPQPATTAVAGGVIRLEPLSYWPRWVLWTLFWWQDLEDRFPLESGISLHRITYWSESTHGALQPASGLLALPGGRAPWKGTVSWQHGTATLRTDAPSAPSLYNGVLAAAIFAGAGYVLVAPDYPGFGASVEPHAYYHSPSIVASVTNLLKATAAVLEDHPRQASERLFLTGFSQGGHASLAAHQELERNPVAGYQLTGSASIAGPMNLADVQIRNALKGGSKLGSLYIAWVAVSYARVYDKPIEEVLVSPWNRIATTLFDGTHDGAEIVASLPDKPADLLTLEVSAALDGSHKHWFVERLRDNGIVPWTVSAPLRAYFGEKDVDVTPTDVLEWATTAKAAQVPFSVVNLGAFDHDRSILAAAPDVLNWFNSMSEPPAPL